MNKGKGTVGKLIRTDTSYNKYPQNSTPYPVATVMYTTATEIPIPSNVTLPKDVLLYTTDKRELFIGAGSNHGLVRVQMGSGSNSYVMDPSDYMQIDDLNSTFVSIGAFTPIREAVEDHTEAIESIQGSLSSIEQRLNGTVLDKDIRNKAVQAITNSDQYINDLASKVNATVTAKNNNVSTIGNNSANGILLQFEQKSVNCGPPKTSQIKVKNGSVEIITFVNRTPTQGSRLIINSSGIFYTKEMEKDPRLINQLATHKEIDALQTMYDELQASVTVCNATTSEGLDIIREYETLLTGVGNDISLLGASLEGTDSVAGSAYNMAQTNNSLYTALKGTVEDLDIDLNTVSILADNADLTARACEDSINSWYVDIEGRMLEIENAIERLQNIQVVYDVTTNTNALTVRKIVKGNYINNSSNPYEVAYGTSLYALRRMLKSAGLNSVTVDAYDSKGNVSPASMDIRWDLNGYNKKNYAYGVQYSGTLQETDKLRVDKTVGSAVKPFIIIKVSPPVSIIDKPVASEGWVLYFIMPPNVRVFPNFIEAVIATTTDEHKVQIYTNQLTDTSNFMGYINDEGIHRHIFMDIVGKIDDSYPEYWDMKEPVIRTFEELDNIPELINISFIRRCAEGLPVPLKFSDGYDNNEEAAKYEPRCNIWGAFNSNGAVYLANFENGIVYPEDIVPEVSIEDDYEYLTNALIFERTSPSPLVYRMYCPGSVEIEDELSIKYSQGGE